MEFSIIIEAKNYDSQLPPDLGTGQNAPSS